MILIVLVGLLIFLHLLSDSKRGLRRSIVITALLLALFIAISTEILSIFDLITRSAVISAWGIAGVVLFGLLFFKDRNKSSGLRDRLKSGISSGWESLSVMDILVVIVIVAILLITLVIALAAPPNNYDSMTYHMARVSHWIQNQNIKYFPTAIERQNTSAPLAEYIILHLQIICRSDKYANLVQWTAFLLLIVLVSDLTAEMGGTRRQQLTGALFAATLPMAIMQSTSTQNDLVTSLGCLAFFFFLLRSLRHAQSEDLVFAGVSLGLAALTKGSSYIYCAGIGLTLALSRLLSRQVGAKVLLTARLALVIMIGLVINAGVYVRNWNEFDHPISSAADRVRTDRISLQGLLVNSARNSIGQLAVPFADLNVWMTDSVDDLFGPLNQDSNYLFQDSTFSVQFAIDEDQATNLLHFLVILAGFCILPWKKLLDQDLKALLAAVLVSGLLYALTIKWQPWGTRLLLPLFFLSSPLAGFLVDQLRFPRLLLGLMLLGFAVYSVPYLVLNTNRPLVPLFKKSSPLRSNTIKRFFSDRPELYDKYADLIQPFYMEASVLREPRENQYFSSNRGYQEDYEEVMDVVNALDLDVLGLDLESNSWEYPIWVYLNRHAEQGEPKLVHLGSCDDALDSVNESREWPEYVISAKGAGSCLVQKFDYTLMVDTDSLDLLIK